MTIASLKSFTQKDLAQMAKQGGVRGWHSMRKDQLVKALVNAAKHRAEKMRTAKKAQPPVRRAAVTVPAVEATNGTHRPVRSESKLTPRATKNLNQIRAKSGRSKNLATRKNKHNRDRVVVMVRDAFWLHVTWEITRQSVERAEAAMSQNWHTAHPHLRLLEVSEGGTTSASERVIRDIEIHGGVSNWYVHVDDPPKSYRLEIGYLCDPGKFFSLARSNVVSTPSPSSSDALDENWTDVAENFDKIYALSGGYSTDGNSTELQELFEERLRRPMGSPMMTRFGVGAETLVNGHKDFRFEVDAELIVYGCTMGDAHVRLRGEPVRLRPDGSFTVRMSLPNQRQVIPVVACSSDGAEQRTIVLAIERNTKVMEPVLRESDE